MWTGGSCVRERLEKNVSPHLRKDMDFKNPFVASLCTSEPFIGVLCQRVLVITQIFTVVYF